MDSSATVPDVVGERVLVFAVGGERFVSRLGSVREIIPTPTIAPLRGAPPFVRGVANVRGRVMTVIDGATRWSTPTTGAGGTLLVLSFDGRWLGVCVDDVDTVQVVDTSRGRAHRDELFTMPESDAGPLRLVDVAILLQQVLRDRGEVKP